MGNWKSDRRVQLAVGLAVVLVAAKWLFTGSLFYAAVDMSQSPADGQTKAGLTVGALLPIVFDVLIGGIIVIGSYAINLAEIVFGRVKQLVDPNTGQPALAASSSPSGVASQVDAVSLDSPNTVKRAADALVDAAAANDRDRGDLLWAQIRKPYAMAELNEAYSRGDKKAAAALVKELDEWTDALSTSLASVSKKGGGRDA